MNDHEVLARLIDDAVEYRRGESYDDLEDEDDLGEDELADRALADQYISLYDRLVALLSQEEA